MKLSRAGEDFSRKSCEKRKIESYVVRRERRFKRIGAMVVRWFLRGFLRTVLACPMHPPFA